MNIWHTDDHAMQQDYGHFEQNFKISDKSLKFIEEWGSQY